MKQSIMLSIPHRMLSGEKLTQSICSTAKSLALASKVKAAYQIPMTPETSTVTTPSNSFLRYT